jgi:hypothetical protein
LRSGKDKWSTFSLKEFLSKSACTLKRQNSLRALGTQRQKVVCRCHLESPLGLHKEEVQKEFEIESKQK